MEVRLPLDSKASIQSNSIQKWIEQMTQQEVQSQATLDVASPPTEDTKNLLQIVGMSSTLHSDV